MVLCDCTIAERWYVEQKVLANFVYKRFSLMAILDPYFCHCCDLTDFWICTFFVLCLVEVLLLVRSGGKLIEGNKQVKANKKSILWRKQ